MVFSRPFGNARKDGSGSLDDDERLRMSSAR
jgi:hypothetical protein